MIKVISGNLYQIWAYHSPIFEVELDLLTDKIVGKKVFMHGHCLDKYSGDLGFK